MSTGWIEQWQPRYIEFFVFCRNTPPSPFQRQKVGKREMGFQQMHPVTLFRRSLLPSPICPISHYRRFRASLFFLLARVCNVQQTAKLEICSPQISELKLLTQVKRCFRHMSATYRRHMSATQRNCFKGSHWRSYKKRMTPTNASDCFLFFRMDKMYRI